MERTTPDSEESTALVKPALRVEGNRLRIEGNQVPLLSGSVDYWRLDPDQWSKILDQVKGLGLRLISICIPWNVHEIASDMFDFGTTDKRRDLEGFLTLCGKKDLYVLIRPGPSVNAEVLNFGLPKRIVNNPAIQAQSATGTLVILPATPQPFPMPSFASEQFYDEISKYFDVLCPILVRHLAPGGPIVGVQIDNELPLLFMHGAFSADYSPMAILWYHEFLASKYPSIGSLNRAYRTRYSRFNEVMPPRALATSEREALPRYFDLIEFQEYYVVRALSVVTSLLWARGVRGIISHHNSRQIFPQLPLNVARVERELDIQGVGLYLGQNDYDQIRRGALYISTVSKLPFLSECSMGTWPWGPALSTTDQQFALTVAVMHGFRGFNIHMLVERNRWLGSPITPRGTLNEDQYIFLKRFLSILEDLQFHTLQRSVPVLLLRNLEYERLATLSNRSNWLTDILQIPKELLLDAKTFSYTETIQQAYPAFWEALYWGLTRSKVPFQIGDTDLDRPALSRYQVIFIPTYDYMSEALQQKLLEYAERGGTVVLGPEIPYLGSDMRTCTLISDSSDLTPSDTRRPLVGLHDSLRIEEDLVYIGSRTVGMTTPHGNGGFIYLGISLPPTLNRDDAIDTCNILNTVSQTLNLQPVGDVRAPSVDEVFWGIRAPKVIFLANPTAQPQSVEAKVAKRALLKDAWTGEQLPTRGPQEVPLQPFATRILEVVR